MKRFTQNFSDGRSRRLHPGPSSAPALRSLPLLSLVYMLCVAVVAVTSAHANEDRHSQFMSQEIRYLSPEAGEVFLVWGVDGWKTLPDAQRPPGTRIKEMVMHTPMTKHEDHFAATLRVTSGTMVDFGFLVTRAKNGVDVRVWEGDGDDPFQQKAAPDHVISVHSRTTLLQSGKPPRDAWNSLPHLMIALLCFLLPLRAGILLVRRRHNVWRRRVLLPAFRKPTRPSRAVDVVLVAAGLLIGLVLAEVILHAMDPHGGFGSARQLEWVRKGGQEIDKSVMLDPTLGLRPRLNHGPYNEYGTVTNTYAVDKSPGTVRVLVLGSNAIFQSPLVEALRHTHSEDDVEIWNGGIPSYGTVQTINFYNQVQSRIQADKIILFIASGDIETTPIAYRDSNQNVVALVPHLARSSLNSFFFIHSHLYRLLVGMRTLIGDPEEGVLQEIRTNLSDLAASLKKERKELLVVFLPLLFPEDMWTAAEKERRVAILNMLRSTDVRYIDFLSPLRAAIDEKVDLRQHAGSPFEPTMDLAKRFVAYLDEHDRARTIDARIDAHESR